MQTAHTANEASKRTVSKCLDLDVRFECREDISHGRYLADELILLADSVRSPAILAHVVQDMIETRSDFTGMHVSFFGRVLELAIVGYSFPAEAN